MNELLKTRLFSLLAEPSQITNEEMQTAYGNFMEQLKIVSQSEQSYSDTFRMLNFTRVEFKALQALLEYEQGEKCSEICLSY